jgi:CheY-like chemotaxis protein
LILLSSIDQACDSDTLAKIGFAAALTKPTRVSELLECIERVMSVSSDAWHQRSQPMLTRARLEAVESVLKYSGEVLVVEDNPVNQKVARRFLERMGLTVTIAADGQQGVALYQSSHFDVILMDVQMPVLDGCAATRAIRKLEHGTQKHIPIVALTADAMVQQLEECRAAGMDDHLTKPIEVEALRSTLGKYLRQPAAIGLAS